MTADAPAADYPARLKALTASPFRLRFELNTGGPYVAMFAMAFDRARQLAREALGDGPVIAITSASPVAWAAPWAVHRYGPQRASAYRPLAEMGFAAKTPLARWRGRRCPWDEGAPGQRWNNRAFTIPWADADLLLWNNIAQDINIRPVAPVHSVLMATDGGLLINAYDDRGMDVHALTAEPLQALYHRRQAWLLDYDRLRMAALFAAAPR